MTSYRNNKLQCHFISWTVGSHDTLVLRLPDDNYCDMGGAIEIAKVLMPDVRVIVVEEGSSSEKPWYVLGDDAKWRCV